MSFHAIDPPRTAIFWWSSGKSYGVVVMNWQNTGNFFPVVRTVWGDGLSVEFDYFDMNFHGKILNIYKVVFVYAQVEKNSSLRCSDSTFLSFCVFFFSGSGDFLRCSSDRKIKARIDFFPCLVRAQTSLCSDRSNDVEIFPLWKFHPVLKVTDPWMNEALKWPNSVVYGIFHGL